MTDLDPTGQIIGSYTVESLIGAGSLARVFRARQASSGQPAALKLFAAELAGRPAFQARFDQVVRAAAGLRHPNVVGIADFGMREGRAYLVMELMPDGSLADLLRERSGALLPIDQCIDLGRQAATALAYAHSQGVIHRDIRPENLLLARSFAGYTLKIGDFGLAQLGETSGQSATGAMPGAPAYLAPEQFQAQTPDGRTDIYSLGVVLYSLVTGRLPFAAATLSEAIAGHVHTPPPPPRMIRPDMPAALEEVILRCLAKPPSERFATADELARALAASASGDMPTFIPPPAPAENAPTLVVPAGAVLPVAQPPAPEPPAPAGIPTQGGALAPSTPSQPGSATQSLIIGTPAPGFPAMPPQKPIPQIQVLDVKGTQINLIDLTGDGVAVGRLPDNDLLIDDDAVSEHHAQIDWDGNRVSVTDLGSKNGTFLSGVRLSAQTTQGWEGGKAIQIGPYWLRLAPALVAAQPSIVGAPPAVSAAGVELPPTSSTPISQPSVRRQAPATPSLGSSSGAASSRGPASGAGIGRGQQAILDAEPVGVSRIDVALEEEALTLTPGQPTVVRMLLTNRDTIVDHYSIGVVGAPKTWTIASALPEYQVLPGKDTAAAITVTVPRTPENHAGIYPLMVQARSKKNPAEAGVAPAQWTVQPFEILNLELKPRRATGWRSAHYTATLKNAGNTSAGYTLSGEDDEQVIDFQFQQDKVFLDPGATARVKLTTRSPLRLMGGSQTRGFTVGVEPEGKKQAQTSIGQFIQRALIPVWLIPLLLMILAALYLYSRLPPTIISFTADPTAQVADTPMTISWQVSNARRVLLQSAEGNKLIIETTPDQNNQGTFKFQNGTTVPAKLNLIAYTRFNVSAKQELPVPIIPLTPTPTFTPTPTSTPVTPSPSPAPITPTTEPARPTATSTSNALPHTNAPIPPPPTPTPATQIEDCGPGTPITITGSGAPAREPFLLYFNGRPVSGGAIGSDGRFEITLLIGNEAPGKYPVEVRERYGAMRVLALFTYEVPGKGPVRLTVNEAVLRIERLTCTVPVPTRAPTPTLGVVVYP